MPVKHCFFCNTLLAEEKHGDAQRIDGHFYNCQLCGKYILAKEAEDLFENQLVNKRHLVAGYLRSIRGQSKEMPTITQNNCTSFFENAIVPQNIMEKLDNILLYFFHISDSIGEKYSFNKYSKDTALFYARDIQELVKMFNELNKMGFIESNKPFAEKDYISTDFCITANGLMRATEISTSNRLSKKVFIAMGFRDDLLKAKDEAIKPACDFCNFDAEIVSQNHNDDITYKIIVEIKKSRFVICDLTYNNQGAYYEAGFARGLGLPVIFCCKREWFDEVDHDGIRVNKLHFDVEHINTIFWSTHAELKEKLIDRIQATIL